MFANKSDFRFLSFSSDDKIRLLSCFRVKLTEQEERLRRLDEDMNRIQDSDQMVNEDLDELDEKKKQLQDKLKAMEKQKQNITESSPVGEHFYLDFFPVSEYFLNKILSIKHSLNVIN